jgi:lysophospholipase L1-like esterase
MRRSAFLRAAGSAAATLGSAALATGATLSMTGCGSSRAESDRFAQGLASKPRYTVVALGDSLAVGTGASAPEKGFIFQAYLRLNQRYPGSRVDDLAMGGATAADVLRLQAPRLAHEGGATVAIVCVGGNDVVRRTAATEFAATYATLVERIRARLPFAKLVLCGVPDVALSPLFTGRDGDTIARLARADDEAVRALARRTGAGFVDLFAVTRARRADAAHFLSDDRFHPSDAGHAAFADALAPALLRAVRPG